jgi:hypothetical protein
LNVPDILLNIPADAGIYLPGEGIGSVIAALAVD